MFRKIEILEQKEPLITISLWVNNQGINNVSPPDANGIIIFYSGGEKLSYLGTLQQFKADLEL